jgi:peptidyl-prolyl cis-trans isomerase D
MMDSIRAAAKGWTAKVLIALLVLSFAVWGVNDVFFGFRSEVLASVGKREISAESFRRFFDSRLRMLSRQSGQGITAENARAIGLDRQILTEMLRDGALEEQASQLKLAVPEHMVAREIASIEAFRNARGEFDAGRFRRFLAENGIDEQSFLADEAVARARRAIAETVIADFAAPATLIEAVVRQAGEERDARYFVITGSESEIAAPTEAELKEFHEQNQRLFTIPAQRSLVLLVLKTSDLAAGMTATDAELQAAFERRKAEYETPEHRTIEQITFPTVEEASKARERIVAGADFLVVAKERGLSEKDVSLGRVRKSDIADPALAEAAFSLAEGQVGEPIQGRLSVALLRATKIEPGTSKTFAEVRDDLAQKLKLGKAAEEVENLHARVEDERAGGASFEDVARTAGVTLLNVPSIDAQGRDAAGKPVEGIPAKQEVVKLAFESDVGVETDPITMGDDGVVWVDVRDARPAAVKPFDSLKGEVEAAWKARKLREKVLERARDIAARGDGGATIESLAQEAGAELKTVKGVKRSKTSPELDGMAVSALFTTADNGFGFAPRGDGKSAVIMQALPVTSPPFDPRSKDSENIRKVLDQTIANDVFASYVAAVQRSLGVSVNDAVWQQLSGTSGQ